MKTLIGILALLGLTTLAAADDFGQCVSTYLKVGNEEGMARTFCQKQDAIDASHDPVFPACVDHLKNLHLDVRTASSRCEDKATLLAASEKFYPRCLELHVQAGQRPAMAVTSCNEVAAMTASKTGKAFERCNTLAFEAGQTPDQSVVSCRDKGILSASENPQFPKCLKTLRKANVEPGMAIQYCSHEALEASKDSDFAYCLTFKGNQNVLPDKAVAECSSKNERKLVSAQGKSLTKPAAKRPARAGSAN